MYTCPDRHQTPDQTIVQASSPAAEQSALPREHRHIKPGNTHDVKRFRAYVHNTHRRGASDLVRRLYADKTE